MAVELRKNRISHKETVVEARADVRRTEAAAQQELLQVAEGQLPRFPVAAQLRVVPVP